MSSEEELNCTNDSEHCVNAAQWRGYCLVHGDPEMERQFAKSPEPESWRDYIEREVELVLKDAGPELVLAMVHSRAIEQPEHYFKNKQYGKDLAQASFGIDKGGYWCRVALRALILLNVPIPEREKLIEEAYEREKSAREAVSKRTKKGPGGPYKEVDLTKLEL